MLSSNATDKAARRRTPKPASLTEEYKGSGCKPGTYWYVYRSAIHARTRRVVEPGGGTTSRGVQGTAKRPGVMRAAVTTWSWKRKASVREVSAPLCRLSAGRGEAQETLEGEEVRWGLTLVHLREPRVPAGCSRTAGRAECFGKGQARGRSAKKPLVVLPHVENVRAPHQPSKHLSEGNYLERPDRIARTTTKRVPPPPVTRATDAGRTGPRFSAEDRRSTHRRSEQELQPCRGKDLHPRSPSVGSTFWRRKLVKIT